MSESYRVVFSGKVEPGKDMEQVIDRFSEKFKLDRKIAEKVIRAGKPVSLKKDLTLEKAEKYVAVLHQLGIEVDIDPKPPVPEPEPVPEPSGLELEPLDNGGGDTTEVLEAPVGINRCPKCGSSRMEMGICQDCGIVASKFLAAQAAKDEEDPTTEMLDDRANPYSAPEAELVEPIENEMTGPTSVPAGNGLAWISKGWWHFKSSPMAWIGSIVVFFIISMVLAFIPFVGSIVSMLIGPVIVAGYMYGYFTVGHLFAGFSGNVGQLMLVAVFYFLLMMVVSVVIGAVMFLLLGGVEVFEDPNALATMGAGPIITFVVLLFLLMIPVAMSYLFAPALVMLDDLTALQAMKYSFMGCLKNLLPLFLYTLVAMVLMIVGSLPFMLGLLIVAPMLIAAIYAAYRDIYFS
ncbi:MAG: BPSS1780 family membrane protein [Candidatus Thiodiazotropha sp.]